jgi:spore germination cell wall hydrolase CwlJ-like protein/SH3-like domain-containing protein
MRRNKKFYVYMMLFVVLIAQLAFSGRTMVGTPEPVGAAVHNAGNAQADSTVAPYYSDNLLENTEKEVALTSDNGSDAAEAAQVEPRIVYISTLSANGEIVDDLTGDKHKSDFEDKVISYCEDRVSIYAEPDEASDVVGCMYSRSQADILEKGEIWTKISSGNVVGYVKNVYMLFGEEADKVAPFIGDKTTVVEADVLNVYASADLSSAVIAEFYAGETINAYEEVGDWVLVECESGYGYVQEDGISSSYDLATAWTIDEENAYIAEQARIEAERREAERVAAARAAQAQSTSIGRTTNAAMSASDSEVYLLACIIEWEAGWEPYEGKLAVANVVLNRVRSPKFVQNSITDVIYAPGQFTGVLDGSGNVSERFAALLANGPSHQESYTAAGEALAGVNNIGDYMFFISVKKANYARYSQYTVINNHCFYAY